ncbi:hypothetical protein OSH11_10500 [Kaistia dalseonensis]|uniref:Oxidoreductase molybdopterin-binding domain-containing protein n=1 Tax=Kaistia dalseonensis TaxID=410840 RepID=A0ABU0H5Y5_9HYPH|nr:hypothetical protein [Kaistia dalseonensis]MCX5495136.1 hypothetical protein [Kaistia dalseonensis]MDQ0437718.1 hypothetical protein [Kaistia dalseonensis]
MTRAHLRVAALALTLAFGGLVRAFAGEAATAAQDAVAADVVVLGGAVAKPIELTEAALRGLPRTEIDIAFETSKGRESARYAGALLWPLLQSAGLADASGKNPGLRHTLMITGRDGYVVALAFGELDPHFEGKSVILAYEGGTPPASFRNLQLVVPGDAHGGRSVKDIARIDVR